MTTHQKLAVLILIAAAVALPSGTYAQDWEGEVAFGSYTTIRSEVLGEARRILAYMPAGYNLSQTSYPVLYVLDGLAHFHHATATAEFLARNGLIPQMIIIGIPNTERARDLTPTQGEDIAESGGAEQFAEFIETELVPWVNSHFRTQPFRIVMGHSLSGMFAINTLLTRPELFDGYIAASPHLVWDDDYVVSAADLAFDSPVDGNRWLYYTFGDEPDYESVRKSFTKVMKKKAPDDLQWAVVKLGQDTHHATGLLTLYQGLEWVYSGWLFDEDLTETNLTALQDHYVGLSERYGYEIRIPEGMVNRLGYTVMGRDEFDQAIQIFKFNVGSYPGSANVYDSLGEGYEAAGELALAKMNYEIAVKKGTENSDPNTRIYKLHLDDITQRMSEFD